MAAAAPGIPLPPLPACHCLACMARDPQTTAGLASLAGLARPYVVDQPFNVGVASGAVQPTVTVTVPEPAQAEVGLLGPVTVRLSAHRIVTIAIQTDNGQVVSVPKASGGLQRPGDWLVFDTSAQITVTNPSANFYVVGLVMAPVWYLSRPFYDRLRQELGRAYR